MCIFDGPIKTVGNTKILVAPVYAAQYVKKNINGNVKLYKQPVGKPMQLVIYSNNVDPAVDGRESARPTAMILPFPLKGGKNRVKLLDLSQYKNFFEDLELLFDEEYEKDHHSNGTDDRSDPIPITYIGSYKASLVHNFESLDRLQHEEFNLSTDVKSILGTYYERGYGFVVAILSKSGYGNQYHPFAYVHELREDGRLFVPSRHYHKKAVPNPFEKYHETAIKDMDEVESDVRDYLYKTITLEDKWIRMNARRQNVKNFQDPLKDTIDWDHEIYVINCSRILSNPILKKPGIKIKHSSTERLGNMYVYVDSQKMPRDIAMGEVKSLLCVKINSVYQINCDFYL
jgi:hypothetical protein